MGSTSKSLLLAISLIVLLLAPSAGAARVGPVGNKAIDASGAQRLDLPDSVFGPESVVFDGQGAGPYVSASDGRVLKWDDEAGSWKTFAYSPSYIKNHCDNKAMSELPSVVTESLCGRPLGLRFHRASGFLYIADTYMGLMRVGKDGGEATVLATKAEGGPFKFTNGVDVDQVTGDVYFTDSSMIYTRAQNQMVSRTGDATGRILKYSPWTKEIEVLASGLAYPNGIAVSSDRTHLIVALTGPCKLIRLWLTGPKANTYEVFAELRGYPDNIRHDGKGGYWFALNQERIELPRVNTHVVGVRIGPRGEKIEDLRAPKSVKLSEVVARENGRTYFGSVELPYVGIVN